MPPKNQSPIGVAVLGAGQRGAGFGRHLEASPELAKVAAVAEPRKDYREAFAKAHGLPKDRVFKDWKEFLAKPKVCDAVVVATMDREHAEPAVKALEKGYHLFLEKPMASSLEDCRRIESAQRRSGRMAAVCHSMRYHKVYRRIRELTQSGAIGDLVSMDQIEQVAFWHYAHSFVRGNWAKEAFSSPMLLSKSCHDIDYLAYLSGRKCLRVSSFGNLKYFRPENAPKGAAKRCTDSCPLESSCAYSALKLYVHADREEWPGSVPSADHSLEAHLEAVRTGPYGRCVWHCDNDVVDHQVVALEYEGGITATFTMSAFTQELGRKVTLHGTEGDLFYDEAQGALTLRHFAGNDIERMELGQESGGHGGGDARALRGWLEAIRSGDRKSILTDAQESLRTHTIVFAAEKARLEKKVVELSEMT
jgi:predicted dehydrogenase